MDEEEEYFITFSDFKLYNEGNSTLIKSGT
jgi:hypothetical protein